MAKTAKPAFAQTPKLVTAAATAANTVLSDAADANIVTLATIGAEGARLTQLWAVPRATIAATAAYIYVSTDGGTTKRLVDSINIGAETLTTADGPARNSFSNWSETNPLILPASAILYAGIGIALAGGVVFAAQYQEF